MQLYRKYIEAWTTSYANGEPDEEYVRFENALMSATALTWFEFDVIVLRLRSYHRSEDTHPETYSVHNYGSIYSLCCDGRIVMEEDDPRALLYYLTDAILTLPGSMSPDIGKEENEKKQ